MNQHKEIGIMAMTDKDPCDIGELPEQDGYAIWYEQQMEINQFYGIE